MPTAQDNGDSKKKRIQEANRKAYLRRKRRLEKARELEELQKLRDDPQAVKDADTGESRLYWFYMGLKLGMTLVYTDNRLKNIDPDDEEKAELWSLDMAQRAVEDDWNAERIEKRWVRAVNVSPVTETTFFKSIARQLDDDVIDVWDFVYHVLASSDPATEQHTTCYIIEYETGVPQAKVLSTLNQLQHLEVICLRDDKQPFWALVQPLWIRRGKNWEKRENREN